MNHKNCYKANVSTSSFRVQIATPYVHLESVVADFQTGNGDLVSWDPHFIRDLNDWELEDFNRFLQVLYSVENRSSSSDMLIWSLSSKGIFYVRSCYDVMEGRRISLFHGRRCGILKFHPGCPSWSDKLSRVRS